MKMKNNNSTSTSLGLGGLVIGLALFACTTVSAPPNSGPAGGGDPNAILTDELNKAGGANGATSCASDEECSAKLPATNPPGCAVARCDLLQRVCLFSAKDNDGDGHATASCAAGGFPIELGIDCDDNDKTTYPGAVDTCDGKDHTCGHSTCACNSGQTRPCYTGVEATRNVGECKEGVNRCVNGQWLDACEGQVLPATAEICDGKDYFCNNKQTTLCPCDPGEKESCFTGPGTVNVGPCAAGERTCGNDGKWGACEGQTVGFTGLPDAEHPCDGTNWWCDPNGIIPSHCAVCTSASPAESCGSPLTCNSVATRACLTDGTRGPCNPPPVTTCTPDAVTACDSCSSLNEFKTGTHKCTPSCNFNGTICTPTGGFWSKPSVDGTWSHSCGSRYDQPPFNPIWIAFPPNTLEPCWLQYGPYFKLPRGRYRWTIKVTVIGSGGVMLDVARNGTTVSGADGPAPTDGFCPTTGGATTCPSGVIGVQERHANENQFRTIDFAVPDSNCSPSYELRVRAWNGTTGGHYAIDSNTLTWVSSY